MSNDEKPPAPNNNPVVLFHLSEERQKAKKSAAKLRRDFLRDRATDRAGDKKIAR